MEQKSEWFCGVNFFRSKFKVEWENGVWTKIRFRASVFFNSLYLLMAFFVLHVSTFTFYFCLTSLTVWTEWFLNPFTRWTTQDSEYSQCQKIKIRGEGRNRLSPVIKSLKIRLSMFIRFFASCSLLDTEKKIEQSLSIYLFFCSVSIPTCIKRVNGGYFPAICRICL